MNSHHHVTNRITWATAFLSLLCASAISAYGQAAPSGAQTEIIKLEATASYYADEFHGRPTSSGELFDMNALTAAHKSLPFGTLLEVTNLENGRKVVVRVNDRGPFVPNRELDVSKRAAQDLDMIRSGVAKVSIRKVGVERTAMTAKPAEPTEKGSVTVTVTTAGPRVTEESAEITTTAISTAPQQRTNALARGAEATWRIQLASFAREENATSFVVKLRKDGFNPAFERAGAMTRVVLAGMQDAELHSTRTRLEGAGYAGVLVRQEVK